MNSNLKFQRKANYNQSPELSKQKNVKANVLNLTAPRWKGFNKKRSSSKHPSNIVAPNRTNHFNYWADLNKSFENK